MKDDIRFWTGTLIRGVVALIVGSAIWVIPDMSRTLLLLPLAVALSIMFLAAYGFLDSALVFFLSFSVASKIAKTAMRIQGALGVIAGILFFSIIYDSVHLNWFLYLIAFQALSTAVAEFVVAHHAQNESTSVWNYIAAFVALLCGSGYLYAAIILGEQLRPRENSWLVYGYLLALGVAQCLTAARMIYADRVMLTEPQTNRS